MKSKYALYALFPLLLIISCSKSDKTYTIEIKDGVKYIRNKAPLWGDTLKVELEFVRKMGTEEGHTEDVWFYNPLDIDMDNEGNMYVVDMGNYRVVKLNSKGEFLEEFGRSGQGPNEFTASPYWLRVDYQGNIYVVHGLYISIFSPDLKEVERLLFKFEIMDFELLSDKTIAVPYSTQYYLMRRNESARGTIEEDTPLLVLYDHEGIVINEIGAITYFDDFDVSYKANMSKIDIGSNNNIYVTFEHQNRIDKYNSNGVLLWRSNRPINFSLDFKIEEEEIGALFILKKLAKVSNSIELDYKERLWIATYTTESRQLDTVKNNLEFHLFDTDGVFLCSVPHPEHKGDIRIIDDNMFFLGVDEIYIYQYRIVDQ